MKKKNLMVCVLFFSLIIVACSSQPAKDVSTQQEDNTSAEEKKESKTVTQTDKIKASTLEELNEAVPHEIDARVAALNKKYEKLQAEIDTYDKYIANRDKMAGYYASVYKDMQDTCICMREYCVKYAQVILESEKPNDEKYEDLMEMYDVVYDDAGEDIYDEYYDGVLKDIYDVYYDGILDEAYDNVEFEEWSDARSEEYKNWSDTRSDTYEIWSDFRSEVYEFWSDLRGEFWDGDLDRVNKKIQDFQSDIMELKEERSETEITSEQPENDYEANAKQEGFETDIKQDDFETDAKQEIFETDIEKEDAKINDGEMRPEFKEAMDSYEDFFDKYCSFMEKYNADPTDIELISAYSDIMIEMMEVTEKFEAWKENDLNTEELKYYIDVNSRVEQKLLEVTNK